MLKYVLHDDLKQGHLIAYTSLCRPILKYADMVIQEVEMVQSSAIRFIAKLERKQGVRDARNELGLQTLQMQQKNHKLNLLTSILQAKDTYSALIMTTLTTRSTTHGELTSICTNSGCYRQRFSPRTI